MLDVRSASLLARYKSWCSNRILEAVAALPEGEATKERPTHFKSILQTLNHMYVVDRVWQAHLQGRPHGFSSLREVPHPQLAKLRDAQAAVDRWYEDWARSIAPAALDESVNFTFVSGTAGSMMRGAIFLHVVNHASYHRGWVADLFFQIPQRPPATDFTVFLQTHGEVG